MKRHFVVSKILIGLLLIGCSDNDSVSEPVNKEPKHIELTTKSKQIIASNNDFGVNLFSEVAKDSDKNLMLSPLSASTALSMLLNGSDGDTYSQIKSTLNFPDNFSISEINQEYKSLVSQLLNADNKVDIKIANAVFYKDAFTVKAPFIKSLADDFSAKVKALDFSSPDAIATINGWASDNTNKKIEKVIDKIDDNAMMFLMNALYFKGNWSSQFKKSDTENKPFHLADGTTVNVPTMNGDVNVKVAYNNSWKALELPYGRTNFTMVVIVPEQSLAAFSKDLSAEVWKDITTAIDAPKEYSEISVSMPKFKFSYEKRLGKYLKNMGMIDAFLPKADLSKISDINTFVSFVKQNTFIEVNEEGTEAASVTTIGTGVTSVRPENFTVDKPFVFAIRERTTNTLLFIGQVTNPQN